MLYLKVVAELHLQSFCYPPVHKRPPCLPSPYMVLVSEEEAEQLAAGARLQPEGHRPVMTVQCLKDFVAVVMAESAMAGGKTRGA